ncbi:MAG: winged helix-turn-helix transcriptional regulator [Spirochaetales bacterium]|uniref:Winged helix-turn-helix transcriptional regulator n=1 Tax=Candidatus Thalassospirochaeta sargassi TaxID=3119039 RepID=A0AAJ1IEZ7_9SPIO|nr:winged helix-turn-helix transcriptional regulator [Spirochaetales bacterium]
MNEKELEILNNINDYPEYLSQRELASRSGMSLGMTNAVLKRLVQKGWLMMRKVNNRNIRYVITPAGMEEITRRSYRYFKRTLKNVAEYKDKIETLILKIQADGYDGLVLVGSSDVDFIVEYLCMQHSIKLVRRDSEITDSTFMLYAESYIPDKTEKKDGVLFLQDVFV